MRHFCYSRIWGTYNVCEKKKEDEEFALFVRRSFHRYVMCDWGDVVDQDVETNNRAEEDGSPITYEALRWQINHACTKAGVEYCGMHVFRHTFASNCYARGCDVKILSKLFGHSDVTITYNLYIHLFGDALEEMRSVLG